MASDENEQFPLVYIILVNWNGWRNTIECLESVFRNDYPNYRVIVCDNDSTDHSIEKIKDWAKGFLAVVGPAGKELLHLVNPPVVKPIVCMEYEKCSAETGGASDAALVLIRTGGNLGFAGGNNVGMRYALARDDFKYVWLLNNDTVIKPDALVHMVKRMRDIPDAGICGSTLLYYDEPGIVQGLGGAIYNKWLGTNTPIGFLEEFQTVLDPGLVERKLQYVIGASMLVSRELMKNIGLMNEDYFLFFEELDWAARVRNRFRLIYAPESIVYHKEGRSTGINRDPKSQTSSADYYLVRNKLAFTRRYFPFALPTVYLGLLITVFNRIRRGQRERACMILDLMLHPGKWVSGCKQ
jgi:GT2 family glycosyltransferase